MIDIYTDEAAILLQPAEKVLRSFRLSKISLFTGFKRVKYYQQPHHLIGASHRCYSAHDLKERYKAVMNFVNPTYYFPKVTAGV
ncbi:MULTISPECIES: hypothetical protein [unclassified Pseudoalteromonas]|uniref:hypothetical protein n=1 Tax=unclassified Pseudoalteromonas TaxID=194690 RepID=UPI00110B2E0A|nr:MULTISPECIES: hypothetical protein [unclassified Pseudoalteromonas]TMP46635.1 hypothetical protein CWB80_09455 [Pseudoalteromonas sp. S1650]TMP68312.1 hypothetical protein CWB79_05740 [Pseudoalteromonas sp. S1649]